MNPYITWHFETVVSPLHFSSKEQRTVPTTTTHDELVSQLADEGHYAIRFVKKEWERYAWPGGYPIYYATKDGGVLCAKCANANLSATLTTDPQWRIVAMDVNYEDEIYCDHCNEMVESAYDVVDADDSDNGEAVASAEHGATT